MEAAITTEEKGRSGPLAVDGFRERPLAGIPAAERRLELAGISTAVLEGGEGRSSSHELVDSFGLLGDTTERGRQ